MDFKQIAFEEKTVNFYLDGFKTDSFGDGLSSCEAEVNNKEETQC